MELIAHKTPTMTANPRVFDGRFFFTNPFKDDFTGRWNGVEYTFPAMTTSPLLINEATPLEQQVIRKRFARDLALREFYKTPKFKSLNSKKHGTTPQNYVEETEIATLVQKCLEPLPLVDAKIKRTAKKDPELSKDKTGKTVIKVYGKDDENVVSLVDAARNATD